MNTFWQSCLARLHGKRLVGLFLTILALSLAASMPVLAVSVAFTHQSSHSSLPMALDINQAFQAYGGSPGADVNPTTLIANPGSFDARPCVAQPNANNCNGIYPSFPPHIDVALANTMGASACFDKKTASVEYLPLDPNANIATIQLWHFSTCNSWSSQILFAIPASQIKDVSVEVDEETTNGFIQWWDNINQLPPTVVASEISTPQPFAQLSPGEQNFYLNNGIFSPLLYSTGAPIAAKIRLDLTTGVSYNYQTPFTAG